jgi:predicted ATPase
VLLSGEAGIGKSRLTAALLQSIAAEPHIRLRHFCSPQHTNSALYPVIGQMERAAALAHSDTAQTKLDKLDAVLAKSSTSAADAALFAEMLSLLNGPLSDARTNAAAAQGTDTERPNCAGRNVCPQKSGADDLRGCALGPTRPV